MRHIKAVWQWFNSPKGTAFKVEPKPKNTKPKRQKKSALSKYPLYFEDAEPDFVKKLAARTKPKRSKK